MVRKLTAVVVVAAVLLAGAILSVAAIRKDRPQPIGGAARAAVDRGPETRPSADGPPRQAATAPGVAGASEVGRAMAAIQRAADANRYVFLFWYEEDDEPTQTARKSFESLAHKLADKADWVAVDRTAPAERATVERYGLNRAPIPLVLAVAPNGAITGGFPASQGTEERLRATLASPGAQKCLKALQERKLVLLCAQNDATRSNKEAMSGVQALRNDARFSQFTEIVKLNPADANEATFMAQLQVDPKTDQAITLVLAPPGAIVASFSGGTDKDTLFAAVLKGCGSGGCATRCN